MFRGRYLHAVDSKGRTALPARFREALGAAKDDVLVITAHIQSRCLVAYPFSEWQVFEERLALLPQFDPTVVLVRRQYVSGATECPVDRQGRILLPSPLRQHAELRKEVLWTGQLRLIELWAKHRWEKDVMKKDGGDLGADVLRKLGELGL